MVYIPSNKLSSINLFCLLAILVIIFFVFDILTDVEDSESIVDNFHETPCVSAEVQVLYRVISKIPVWFEVINMLIVLIILSHEPMNKLEADSALTFSSSIFVCLQLHYFEVVQVEFQCRIYDVVVVFWLESIDTSIDAHASNVYQFRGTIFKMLLNKLMQFCDKLILRNQLLNLLIWVRSHWFHRFEESQRTVIEIIGTPSIGDIVCIRLVDFIVVQNLSRSVVIHLQRVEDLSS